MEVKMISLEQYRDKWLAVRKSKIGQMELLTGQIYGGKND